MYEMALNIKNSCNILILECVGKQMCANNILTHALRIMVALLCIALLRVCQAITNCHGMKLGGVTLLTLRSEPELKSVLFFVDADTNCDPVIDMK